MAKVSRKALQQAYDILGSILNGAAAEDAAKRAKDDNANELDREDNDKARAQDTPRVGGLDSVRAMREQMPNYYRLIDGSNGRGEAPPPSELGGVPMDLQKLTRDGRPE